MKLLATLRQQRWLYSVVPLWVRRLVQKSMGWDKWFKISMQHGNPYVGTSDEYAYTGTTDVTLAITFDFAHEHYNYMAACHDLNVSYKVIDFSREDWIERVEANDCAGILYYPMVSCSLWKHLSDDRIKLLTEEMGLQVYPDSRALWLYERKFRTRDWMRLHGIRHPQSWIFYDRSQALSFLRNTRYPVVLKTDLGAGAKSVRVLHSYSRARRIVNLIFDKGWRIDALGIPERQWGAVMFQKYIEDAKEWRIVRIGNSYFCRLKLRKGDYHSGSGRIEWAEPPRALLDSTRKITDAAEFRSMNVDFFEDRQGRFYVNELHAYTGGKILKDNRLCGRWLYESSTDEWKFDRGDWFRNRGANLRVLDMLSQLGRSVEWEPES